MHEHARTQTCGQPHAPAYTRASEKHAQTHKHTPGGGSSRAQLPPVLSQLMVTWVTQLQESAKMHEWKKKKRDVGVAFEGRFRGEENGK